MMGILGCALIAAAVAIAAETPQMEMPDARGAAVCLGNLKTLLAKK